MYVTQPVLPVLSREFGVGPARAGLTVSFVVLGIALASSFYGPLSDALGRARVMTGATGALALATLACAFAQGFHALLALRALQGLLVPGMTAVSVAYAGDRFRTAELPRVVGGIIAASVVGGLVGRIASGAITAWFGWRMAFAAFAFLTAGAGLVLARGLSPTRPEAPPAWRDAYRGMLRHLRNRRLVGAYLVGASLFFGWIGIFTYLPFYLSAPPWQLGTGWVSAIYLVYAAGVIVSPIAGRLAVRLPATTLIGAGLVIELVGMLVTLVASLPVVVVALVVLVFGTFTAQAVAPAFVNVTAPTAKGGASALYLTFYYVGGTLGAWLPGHAWRAWGWKGVVATCGVAVVVALGANGLLCRRPAGAVQPE
jgi:YNFM family putative membrane transporter